jgi:hypothetical protein
VVLDMGEYEAPLALASTVIAKPGTLEPLPSLPQLAALRAPSATGTSAAERWPAGDFLPGAMTEPRSTGGGGGGGGGTGGGARRLGARVRLVQICAPPILARAKVRGPRHGARSLLANCRGHSN